MTNGLIREQLRAGRRALITASALIAATMALASFAVFVFTTQSAVDNGGYRYVGNLDVSDDEGYGNATADEVNAMVQSIEAAGDDAIATIATGVDIATPGDIAFGATKNLYVDAVGGLPDWDAMLISGDAPAPGEVVLQQSVADALRVDIGDTVVLTPSQGGADQATDAWEFTVSGLSHGNATGAIESWVPDGYTAWSEWEEMRSSDIYSLPWATFGWNPPSETLDHYTDWLILFDGRSITGATPASLVTALFAIALSVATIAAAFGLGRAQAQGRTRWVATARALGATRASVTRAALVEWAVLTVTGGAIGVVIGYVATTLVLAWQRAAATQPALPALPVVPSGVGLALLAFGAFLAGVVALIPAIWARSVSPVDALKDASPITERTRPHAIRTWALVAVFVVAVGVNYWLTDAYYSQGIEYWGWSEWYVNWGSVIVRLAIALIALAIAARALRGVLRAVGRRLALSASATLASVGDVLGSRAAGTAGLVVAPWAAAASIAFMVFRTEGYSLDDSSALQTPAFLTASTLVIMLVVAHVASAASLGAASADWATRRALGMSLEAAERAAGLVHGVSLAAGITLGGTAGIAALWLTQLRDPYDGTSMNVVASTWPVALVAIPCVLLATAIFAGTATRVVGGKDGNIGSSERSLTT